MAQYEHLPIYRKAYDFALYCEKIVRGFSRYHKYTLGTELRQGSRQVIRLIRQANSTRERARSHARRGNASGTLLRLVPLWAVAQAPSLDA